MCGVRAAHMVGVHVRGFYAGRDTRKLMHVAGQRARRAACTRSAYFRVARFVEQLYARGRTACRCAYAPTLLLVSMFLLTRCHVLISVHSFTIARHVWQALWLPVVACGFSFFSLCVDMQPSNCRHYLFSFPIPVDPARLDDGPRFSLWLCLP
jgi:hypothetical protein